MSDVLWVGLQLTLYGTGLVFLVLAFLWGLMSLLLRLDTGEPVADGAAQPPSVTREEGLTLAEQAAVLLAVLMHAGRLGEDARGQAPLPEAVPSPWVIVGRERQLNRGPWRRRTFSGEERISIRDEGERA